MFLVKFSKFKREFSDSISKNQFIGLSVCTPYESIRTIKTFNTDLKIRIATHDTKENQQNMEHDHDK